MPDSAFDEEDVFDVVDDGLNGVPVACDGFGDLRGFLVELLAQELVELGAAAGGVGGDAAGFVFANALLPGPEAIAGGFGFGVVEDSGDSGEGLAVNFVMAFAVDGDLFGFVMLEARQGLVARNNSP